jgi:hypothetical protein
MAAIDRAVKMRRIDRRVRSNIWIRVWMQLCVEPTPLPGAPSAGKEIAPGEQFTTQVEVAAWDSATTFV